MANTGGWEDAPQGASLQGKMLANDAVLQQTNPDWKTGMTAAQLKQESNYDPNAVSPKGALGMAQVEPATLKAIEQQTGRKLDPNNVNDALFIHRYVMDQNLKHFGNPEDALRGYNGGWNKNNWLNPETQAYVDKVMGQMSQPDTAPTQLPTLPTAQEQPAWEDAPAPKQGAFSSALKGAEASAIPAAGGLAGAALGAAGGMAVGGPIAALVGGVAGGFGGGEALGAAQNWATKKFPELAKELGLDQETIQKAQQANPTAFEVGGFLPQLAAMRPSAGLNLANRAVGAAVGAGTTLGSEAMHGGNYSLHDVIMGAAGGALLDKPWGIGAKMFPHGGEAPPEDIQRKLSSGNLDQPEARPWEEGPQPEGGGPLQNQPNAGPPRTFIVNEEGVAATPSEMDAVQPFKDEMERRVAEFNKNIGQPDLFAATDEGLGRNREVIPSTEEQMKEGAGPTQERTLTTDEFKSTLQNLSEAEGARFTMPDDPEKAYGKYLDTVRDDQGGLFDGPAIAKNFAELAKQEAIDRFVDNHPIIKTAESKIANLEALIASNPDRSAASQARADLQKAMDTRDLARENLAKQYQGADLHPTHKDGITYLNMGVPIPDWIKNGLMRMLQAFHGAVIKPIFRKLVGNKVGGFGDIVGNGIKDMANKFTNKSVDVQVNQKAVEHFQQNTPLGKFDRIKEFIPDDRPYEQVKQDISAANDMDSNLLTKNVTAQGGLWASIMSKNPGVKWAYTKINSAMKRVDVETRRLLTDKQTGLRSFMQKLSDTEKGEIHTLMDMNEGEKVFTENELKARGYNDKQIGYYKRFQEVTKEIFDKFNEGLTKAGLPNIDARTAYMASRFMGDFRSLIYQKGTTRPVGFVGHNTRAGVKAVLRHLEEQFPGKYDFEEPTLNRGAQRAGTNMFQGYLNLINHFQLNDPEMAAIMEQYQNHFSSKAAQALGALQHAKDKQGIFGAEGRKIWADQVTNANEGMKSQLTHMEHMIRWSEIQDAGSQIKQMLGDEDLNDKPNMKSYVKDYWANAIGQNKTALTDAANYLMDTVAQATGFGPSVFRGANNFQKSALLQLWLGFLRLPHSALTMTQFFQSNPAFAQLMRSRGLDISFWGNSMKGTATATAIAKKSLGIPTKLNAVDQAIYDYNKQNGVFDVNLKSHLTDINSSAGKRNFNAIAEANITYPEAALRSTTFSIWTHALSEAGMPLKEALGTAENLTRSALVDYRPFERPLVYGKMGFLGDIASTLTRFKMNQISQHQFFAKEMGAGNFAPMATLLASSIAFAGMSGLLGFNYADELYHGITYLMGKPDRLKSMMLRNLPDVLNYGLLSQLGINMQGSYSNADTIPDNPWSTLFPTGSTVMDMAKALAQAVYYHDDATAKKLLYNFSPTSIKGIEENTMFSKTLPNGNKQFFNPNTKELQSERTPAEQTARNLAFHPFQEARDTDVRRFAKEAESDYASLREKDLTRYTNKLSTGTASQSDIETLRQDWIAHRGDPKELPGALRDFYQNRALTANQREIGTKVNSLADIYKYQDIAAMRGSKR